MRQEMLATQFLDVCDRILKASGLDLKMKKYKCIPVGERKGFIEWVPGAFSLSELCKPMGSAIKQNGSRNKAVTITDSEIDPSSSGIDNDTNSSAFIRTGGWCKFESMRSLRQTIKTVSKHGIGISGNNPVQDFFRSNAYDAEAPYLIQKEVMDNFVKSCAGYSVITYLLGVGDRHTDNLLLHPRGHFLHCDFSFILGQDPKTYLPMRITEHMVNGMGGRDSDNFSMFLSLAGAAFVTLRRHASVRVLLSTVRMMADSEIPDITINQNPDVALQGMHERFRLDLNDDEAVSFLEENIERSISSKIWIAVDAIHSLGKRF
jgi:phosphatidylinositol kinase/protein kinase (PI-3  family)